MSILLQKKNVGSYSYMSSPNIYYRAVIYIRRYNKALCQIWVYSYKADLDLGYTFTGSPPIHVTINKGTLAILK